MAARGRLDVAKSGGRGKDRGNSDTGSEVGGLRIPELLKKKLNGYMLFCLENKTEWKAKGLRVEPLDTLLSSAGASYWSELPMKEKDVFKERAKKIKKYGREVTDEYAKAQEAMFTLQNRVAPPNPAEDDGWTDEPTSTAANKNVTNDDWGYDADDVFDGDFV